MDLGKRIIVVGTTGSGKSTLASQLAGLISAQHIELDSLFWGENWSETPDDEFLKKIQNAIAADKWVIDGNYSRTRDITWPIADMVIWLDYPLYIIYWRLFWRTLMRTVLRQELWQGNKERFWIQFFSRESLLLYAKETHERRTKMYETIITENLYPHLKILRFKHPRETNKWLKHLQDSFQSS